MNDTKQRARNAMIGLAIGDALSWTAMFHRSMLLPPWTRRVRREMDSASETSHVIATPMPFSLNQPASHFDLSPTAPTEWAAATAGLLLNPGAESYERSIYREWMTLAHAQGPIRGGVSTQAALHNLRNGMRPPQTGRENPHYFDDGAMPRAVPIGIRCAGHPDEAARLAELDASVTNSEDGVWAAQALAVVIGMTCAGKSIPEAISAANRYLPESSWVKRTVNEASRIAERGHSVFALLPELQTSIVNREYSYGNVAPETLALTFVIAQLRLESVESAVMTALCFAKSGETLPSIVGAVAGAMQSTTFASDQWLRAIGSLKGICIPSLAGINYLALIEQIANRAGDKISL